MLFITYYRRFCLKCKKAFQTTLFRNRVRVGSGIRTCSKCKTAFSDGTLEWPDMTPAQRRRFLFGGPFWPLMVSGAAISGFLLYLLIKMQGTREGTQIILEILGDVWLAYGSILAIDYLACWVQIGRSKKRVAIARQLVAGRKEPQTGIAKFCLECELPIDESWQFCPLCGANQNISPQMVRAAHELSRAPLGAMSELNQIRINELARELEIKARTIIDYLPQAGVIEWKGFSSSIDLAAADKVRKHFREVALTEATAESIAVENKASKEGVGRAIPIILGLAVEETTGLESAVLTLLSRANRPLRARAIAAILSGERSTSVHKREINPTLYRMLSRGRLCRDLQFRWYLNEKSHPLAPGSSEDFASQPEGNFHSPIPSKNVAPVAESSSSPEQSQNEDSEDSSNRVRSGVANEGDTSQAPLPHTRDYGKFRIVEVIRPYMRNCTWCSLEIPEGKVALVVDGLVKMAQYAPRFCSEDCFQNWESIYWQRVALSHLGLSKEERKLEERCLRRQKYFLRSNNF